jgi:hypothetical protein
MVEYYVKSNSSDNSHMAQLEGFGRAPLRTPTQVRLYADEIAKYRNSLDEKWAYIGLLAVPEARYGDVLTWLADDRVSTGYNEEVHFTELKNCSRARCYNEKTLVARRWVERVLWDDQKIFHFNLFGVNLSNLQHRAFGTGKKRKRNIYNRFFRTATFYVLKSFFGAVVVTHVFHDSGSLERDEIFDWHTIWRLKTAEPDITFLTGSIQLIDSDHRKEQRSPNDSHLIQLCDVLLGGLSQCLDARTKKAGCCEIAELLLPLAERLTDPKRVGNPHSRYHYHHRIHMSFFPSKKLTLKELEEPYQRVRSHSYINRPLLFKDYLSGQQRLL